MRAVKVSVPGPSEELKATKDCERPSIIAGDRARESVRQVEEEADQLLLEIEDRGYRLEIETAPSAPFFRCDLLGPTRVLYLNRAHRFYTDVYDGPRGSTEVRAALETLLFAIGDSMLDATEENQRAYRAEVPQWSTRLNRALARLGQNVALSRDVDGDEMAA